MSDKLLASKNAMHTMVMLYITELEKEGIDVRQKIATDITEIINISEEQKQYIIDTANLQLIKEYIGDIQLISTKLLNEENVDLGTKALLKREADELYNILVDR